MSIEVSAQVWKHSKQSGTRLLLLVAIADYTNAEGWAWPSVASLCQRTRMGERYVQKMIREIQADGELEIRERPNASNYYRVTVGVNDSSPVPPGSGRGELPFAIGVNPDAPKPLREPSRGTVSPLTPKGDEASSIQSKMDLAEGFAAFWIEYPRKVKKDKALAAWKRKRCAFILEEIMLAIAIQKTSPQWLKKAGQFIPHPTTWINGGEWQNEGHAVNQPQAKEKRGF